MNTKYLNESKGITKISNFSTFLTKNVNKNIYENINKIINDEFNKKIRNIDFKLNEKKEEIEDLEIENTRMEDNFKNKLDYVFHIVLLFYFKLI